MKQAVISLEGITKTYVNGKLVVPVLHGIDLNIYRGRVYLHHGSIRIGEIHVYEYFGLFRQTDFRFL